MGPTSGKVRCRLVGHCTAFSMSAPAHPRINPNMQRGVSVGKRVGASRLRRARFSSLSSRPGTEHASPVRRPARRTAVAPSEASQAGRRDPYSTYETSASHRQVPCGVSRRDLRRGVRTSSALPPPDDHHVTVLFREHDLLPSVPVNVCHTGADLAVVPVALNLRIAEWDRLDEIPVEIEEERPSNE